MALLSLQVGKFYLLEGLGIGATLGLLVAVEHLAVVVLHHLDAVPLVFVRGLVALDLAHRVLNLSLELLLFVVEFVFQGQEVLIERDAITEKRFVAASLVLLVDFAVLEQLDLGLHRGDLLVQVEDDVVVDDVGLTAALLSVGQLLNFVRRLLQVRVTLELPVDDRSGGSLVDIVIVSSILDVACGAGAGASSRSYSAYSDDGRLS